jgi:F0F1-type ATP synthase assembly protein I
VSDSSNESLDDSVDDRDQRDRRQTWTGFSDALARGIELVATPLLFALGGWYLDRWAGTRPLFTLVLFLLAVAGMSARMYYGYMAAMQEHDRAGAWAPRPPMAAEGGDLATAAESGDLANATESGDTRQP